MGASAVPFVILTLFWFVVGGVLPWFVPKGVNRGAIVVLGMYLIISLSVMYFRGWPYGKSPVIQTMLVTTAVCCYLFWLCCYMVQMNPLFGPQLPTVTLAVMKEVWK